jgi:putative nucleotidyltransferase with HDIG domain
MAGTFLVVLMTLGLMYQLMRQRLTVRELRASRLVLMALLLLAPLVLTQVLLVLTPALTAVYEFIPAPAYTYLIPAALTALLASILLRFEVAVYLGIAVSVCLAVMLGNNLPVFIYGMLGSAVAAIPMRRFETRYALWQQGARLSVINLAVLGVLHLLDPSPVGWPTLYEAGAAVLNGWGVAFLAATLLPLLERAFDITTNLRLLELSNMNQPALKELAVRAPGTYHHSIVVGNLSESAADGIGVNPLLVRVASYYHDLGKMLCPLYFVENQGQRNFHDDLPAKTSARIIVNHVRDGLEIARRYKLGSAITDIVAQHHGDSLVRYFFHKAQEELDGGAQGLDEAEFRYPGPRPQSKEAGLVMVADVTEAAIRSLDDPSPDEIRQMVLKLATRIYMEGELDESGLTFNDLNYIEKMFTRMLLSIHHHRITYPEFQVPHGYTGEAAPQAVPDPSPPAAPENEPPEPEARAHRRRLAGD